MPHILLLEDEREIRLGIKRMLSDSGYTVTTSANVIEFEAALRSPLASYDLLIMDRDVPGPRGQKHDSRDTLRAWRNKGLQTPVIFISGAHTSTQSRLEGAKGGLSRQYVTKDGNYDELLLEHVREELTRGLTTQTAQIKGRWSLDKDTKTVRVMERAVRLSDADFETFNRLFDAYKPTSDAPFNFVSLEKWGMSAPTLTQRIKRLRNAFSAHEIDDVVETRARAPHRSVAYALIP